MCVVYRKVLYLVNVESMMAGPHHLLILLLLCNDNACIQL